MGIKQTLDVINAMEREGVIERYAIGGAVAAYNYIEPAVTEDLDIFVSFKSSGRSGLLTLEPLFAYLRSRGYTEFRKEGVMVEGWPVQFLPISDPLDEEAVEQAEAVDIKANGGQVSARVMTPEHLVALALSVGRAKDFARIIQFLQEKAVNLKRLKSIVEQHLLLVKWRSFCAKTGTRDPLVTK